VYKKIFLVLVPIFLLFILIGGWLFFVRNTKGAVFIDANLKSEIFIDGESVGYTPYDGVRQAGEVTVKLVPDSFDKPLVPFETRVTLVSGVKTIVRRTFGVEEQLSSSEIISFERRPNERGSISVVSLPDSVEVFVDGARFDTTPAKIDGISAGNHNLSLKATGFKETTFPVQVTPGYGITIVAHLAKDPAFTPPQIVEEQQAVTTERKEAKILDTPTGFLRVRTEPSPTSEEIGRVIPGKTYDLIEEDSTKKWLKINFEEKKEGWISSQYATVSATPSQ
jgi:hypothetical protein